jgi:hypothetical protein
VVRLADIILNSGKAAPAESACPELEILAAEVAAFREETEVDGEEGITQEDRVWVGWALAEGVRSQAGFAGYDFYRWWSMDDTSDAFKKKYQEDFRRLLNRLTVGRNLAALRSLEKEVISELQSAVVANERASGVGFTALRDMDPALGLIGIGEAQVEQSTGQPE